MRVSTIVILVGAAAFGGWVFYSLMHVEPVRIVESNLQHENGQVFVEGKIENSGAEVAQIDLEVRYFNSDGRALGTESVTIPTLNKGAVEHFRTAPRADGGVATFSIVLSHGKNPYGN